MTPYQNVPALPIEPPYEQCPNCGTENPEGWTCDCGYPFQCVFCGRFDDTVDESIDHVFNCNE